MTDQYCFSTCHTLDSYAQCVTTFVLNPHLSSVAIAVMHSLFWIIFVCGLYIMKPDVCISVNSSQLRVFIENCPFSSIGKYGGQESFSGIDVSSLFEHIECGQLSHVFAVDFLKFWHRPLLIVGSSSTIDFVTSLTSFYNLPKIDTINFYDFFLLFQNNKNFVPQVLIALLRQWSWENNHLYIDEYYENNIQPNVMHMQNETGLVGNFSAVTTHVVQKLPPIHFVDYLQQNVQRKSIFVLLNASATHQLISLASKARLFSSEVKWFIFYNEHLSSIYDAVDLPPGSHMFIISHRGRITNLNSLFEEYIKLTIENAIRVKNLPSQVETIPRLMESVRLEVHSLTAALEEETGSMPIQNIARWSPTTGLQVKATPRFINFHKKVITVAMAEIPPYVFIRRSLIGTIFPSGYIIDVINLMATIMNFTIEYKEGKSNNRSRNGVVDLLVQHEADVGIHDMIVTPENARLVDLSSVALDTQAMAGLYRRPSAEGDDLQKFAVYWEPFDGQVWLASAITLFMLISTFYWSSWVNRYVANLKTKYHLDASRTVLLGIQAVAQQGCELDVHHSSGRLFFGSLWFFALLMFSAYSATLVSYLTITRFSWPFRSIEELTHNRDYRIFMMTDSRELMMISESQSVVYRNLFRRIFKEKTNTTVESMFEALQRVSRGKYVFLYDDKSLLYATRNTCDLVVSEPLTKPYHIALAFQKGSFYKASFDKVLRNLNDAGILFRLKDKWWGNRLLCSQAQHIFVSLSLTNTATAFLLLLIGLVFCFLVICVEHLFFLFVLRSKNRVKMKSIISNEANESIYLYQRKIPKHTRSIHIRF